MDNIIIEVNKTDFGNLNFQIVAETVFFSLRVRQDEIQVLTKELKRIVEDLEAMNETN